MSKFRVSKEIEFDAGHRVPLHESKCKNPHGHRYRVVVNVIGHLQRRGSETGMVMDFSRIKDALTEHVHDPFDHGFIIQTTDSTLREVFDPFSSYWKIVYVPFPPTAEELALHFYNILSDVINVPVGGSNNFGMFDVKVESVQVYETPTSMAQYPWSGDETV